MAVPPPAQAASLSRFAIVSGAIGNAMEWYDFGLYGFFAPVLARLFFPSADQFASLLATFAVFAGGFLARPVGGVIFGHFGDRIGRRNTLAASVILMAIPTFALGLLPTYAQAGVLAPILLVAIRLLQGLSAGGEVAGSFSFLLEHAPPGRRGFTVSWSPFTLVAGILLGSGVGWALTSLLTPEALDAWGWRVAFMFGITVGLVGLWMRLRTTESPSFTHLEQTGQVAKNPIGEVFQTERRSLLAVIGVTILNAAAFYVLLTYTPTYLSSIVGMPPATALGINTLGLVVDLGLIPLGGWLSDRIGRRPIVVVTAVAYLVLSYPLFVLMSRGDPLTSLIVQIILVSFFGIFYPAQVALCAESFPTRVRYTAYSIGHNVTLAIFGGTAPFIVTYLISATGNRAAPGIYVAVAAGVSLIAVWFLKDRFREPLR